MGDIRFAEYYQRLRESRDISATLRGLGDDEVIAALAAASRERDPYLANVLATEAQNRVGRKDAIIGTLGEGVYAVDAHGILTFLNPAAERMLGWSLADVLGRDMHEVVHAHEGHDDGPARACPMRAALRNVSGVKQGEDAFRRRDGSSFPILYTAAPIEREGDILGAVVVFHDITEVKAAVRRRAVRYAVMDALTTAETLDDAAPRILEAFCGELGWVAGGVWQVDHEAGVARCIALWHRPGLHVEPFETASRELTLPRGTGLPGRVWSEGRALWVKDTMRDLAFPRAEAASRSGIRSGFAFPVIRGRGEVRAVVELFRSTPSEPDPELLDLATTVGDLLSSFMERKEAERAVLESEAVKRAILQSALDVIITMDHHGVVVEWNPAAERLFEVPASEAIGQNLADLIIPPRLRAAHHAGIRRYLETGEGPVLGRRLEMPAWRRDGTEFPVELAIVPIRVGSAPLFTGYMRDLTEQRRAEDALRQLAAVVDTSQEAITLFSGDGIVRAWNKGAERLYGYSAEEMVGKSIFPLTPPDLIEQSRGLVARALQGERIENFDTQRVRKDGTLVDVSISINPIHDAVGRVAALSGISRDVTRRKRLEVQLQSSERRYRALYEANPSMYFAVDERGAILSVNASGARHLGYKPDELVGRPVLDLFHPDDREEATKRLESAFALPSELRTWKLRKQRKDGGTIWVRETSRVVDEGDRRVALILCDDISAEQAELSRMRYAAQRYRGLFEHSRDGVFSLDLAGRFTAVNPAAQRMGGYDVAEVLGQPFLDLVAPEDRERAWTAFQDAARGEPQRYELTIRRKDGSLARVEAVKIPIVVDGEVVGVHGVSADLTQRRRAESILAGQTRILETIAKGRPLPEVLAHLCRFIEDHAEGVRASILLLDEEGRRLRVGAAPNLPATYNAAIDGIEIGPNAGPCGASAFLGKPVAVRDIREDPRWDHHRDPALAHGLISCWSIPVLTSDGKVAGTFAMYHDHPAEPTESDLELQSIATRLAGIAIERERADRERRSDDAEITELNLRLQQANEELERRVRERTQELAATNRELESFSYTVSHDLRAPLRGIEQYARALEEDYADRLDEDGRHSLKRMQSESQRLSGLIHELLQLSKVARGPIERLPVDLSALANDIAGDLKRRDPQRRVRFEIEQGLVAEGETALLRAVLENLLGNAWKFTTGRDEAVIELGAKREPGETVYFVRDNGAGFDMARADRLFKPFQRLHTREQYEGTGIGLATVQRIVQRHGGRIWAEGRVGEGATFYFTLG